MAERDENLMARWSRRKDAARRGSITIDEPGVPVSASDVAKAEGALPSPQAGPSEPAASAGREEAQRLTDLADIDFDALGIDSDYTQFMGNAVPDDVRNKALRKLWESDPLLTLHDGLDDCCGDYTDARWATGEIATLYRVGKGFLSDEEVAAWERLGRPIEVVAQDGEHEVGEAPTADAREPTENRQTEVAAAAPRDEAGAGAGAGADQSPTAPATSGEPMNEG